MNSRQAKDFLISKVIAQSEVEHVPLSSTEKQMLLFSETDPPSPDILAINRKFEKDHDNDEYEAKIAGLLKNARERDCKQSFSADAMWNDALHALKEEDHYILAMADQAFRARRTGKSRLRDFVIYIAVGLFVVLLVILKVMWEKR